MINPMDLTGRNVMVTGASSGIGRETSILLSQLGAKVVLVGRHTDRLAETSNQMQGSGHLVETIDLERPEEIPTAFKRVLDRLGPLYGLVHCAGIQQSRSLRMLNMSGVEKMMSVNLYAGLALAKAFCQKGSHTDEASIVFIAGGVAIVGLRGAAGYAATKGAVLALSRSLALELADRRIRVNCVCPGYVDTDMWEGLRRALTAEQISGIERMHPLGVGRAIDVGYAVAFLLADTARWITGSAMIVDGGYTATAHAPIAESTQDS